MAFTQTDRDAGYLEILAHVFDAGKLNGVVPETTARRLREVADRIRKGYTDADARVQPGS